MRNAKDARRPVLTRRILNTQDSRAMRRMRNLRLFLSYLFVAGQKLPNGNGRRGAHLHGEGAQQAAGQDHFRRTRHGN